MDHSKIISEIEAMIALLEQKNVEVSGLLYVAQNSIKNLIHFDLDIKFNVNLFIGKLWLITHEAIKNKYSTHCIPSDIIENAPTSTWNIHLTISKIKEEVNEAKIQYLLEKNARLKEEIIKLKSRASFFSWFRAAASIILPISIFK